MIKKKAKRTGKAGKSTGKAKKSIKGSSAAKAKKPVDPAEVRKDIAKIVGLEAMNMTEAVIEEAMKGLVAPTKFLFEVAGVFPPAGDGEQATEEEDCLAKTLLARLNLAKKPAQEEENEPAENVDVGKSSQTSEKAGDDKAVAVVGTE